MSRARSSEAASIPAYAIGVGLVFMPLVGIPVRFAFQEVTPLLVYVAAFFLGTAVGLLFAVRRKRRPST